MTVKKLLKGFLDFQLFCCFHLYFKGEMIWAENHRHLRFLINVQVWWNKLYYEKPSVFSDKKIEICNIWELLFHRTTFYQNKLVNKKNKSFLKNQLYACLYDCSNRLYLRKKKLSSLWNNMFFFRAKTLFFIKWNSPWYFLEFY